MSYVRERAVPRAEAILFRKRKLGVNAICCRGYILLDNSFSVTSARLAGEKVAWAYKGTIAI